MPGPAQSESSRPTRTLPPITAAPASAAPIAASAISFDVTGRWGDIDGVWISPVTAQVMITGARAAAPVATMHLPPVALHRFAHAFWSDNSD